MPIKNLVLLSIKALSDMVSTPDRIGFRAGGETNDGDPGLITVAVPVIVTFPFDASLVPRTETDAGGELRGPERRYDGSRQSWKNPCRCRNSGPMFYAGRSGIGYGSALSYAISDYTQCRSHSSRRN